MSFWNPRRFLFKYSLLVGTVFISVMGLTLMVFALLILAMDKDPEPDTSYYLAHFFLVLIFIISGAVIYIILILAAYKESSGLANCGWIFMIIHLLFWLILTISSFVNDVTVNRIVCIDNRCGDRLFIKNSNWRQRLKDEYYDDFEGGERSGSRCGDAQQLKNGGCARVFEDDIPDNDDDEDEDKEDYVSNEELIGFSKRLANALVGDFQLNRHKRFSKFRSKENQTVKLQIQQVKPKVMANEVAHSVGKMFVDEIVNTTTEKLGEPESGKEPLDSRGQTPIGYVRAGETAHLIFSVVCSILILGLVYIYPIIIIRSYARQLKELQKTNY